MADDLLASKVAADMRRNLEARAAGMRDVYGVCLFADDLYGEFLISFATESWFEREKRLPPYDEFPDEVLSAPAGIRWSIGDWHRFPDDKFITDETEAALRPLASRLNDEHLDTAVVEAEGARWRELAFASLELARPLEALATTDYAIAFVVCPDRTIVDDAEMMLRTAPAGRFHEVFAAWRRLARLVESARIDETYMAVLRQKVADGDRFPTAGGDELTAGLRACGLWWEDVTSWTDRMRRALAVAEQV